MKELIVDQSLWDQVVISGQDRVRFLQGMCTGDVAKMSAGDWMRTLVLSAKGRILVLGDLVCRDDDLVLICQPGLGQEACNTLSKFAITDDVEFAVRRGPLHRVWTDASTVWTAAPVFESLPGDAATAEDVEIRRVEAGLPLYGADVDDSNFPFESSLDQYVDYKKGCFIGQEPVARVHARAGGQGQKVMRGLKLAGDGPAPAGQVFDHPDKPGAAVVTSSVISPSLGPIALAYVRKEAWDLGTELSGERSATVAGLPFSADG